MGVPPGLLGKGGRGNSIFSFNGFDDLFINGGSNILLLLIICGDGV